MIYRSVSAKSVIAKVYRDLQLKQSDRWIDMLEWIGEALEHIGSFNQLIKKEEMGIVVKNYRAILPCDIREIVQASKGGEALQYLGGSFDTSFHCEDSINLRTQSRFGYNINGSYMNFNFTNGTFACSFCLGAYSY